MASLGNAERSALVRCLYENRTCVLCLVSQSGDSYILETSNPHSDLKSCVDVYCMRIWVKDIHFSYIVFFVFFLLLQLWKSGFATYTALNVIHYLSRSAANAS